MGTVGENTRDAIFSKRLKISGSNNINAVYDEEYIHYICSLMEKGKSNKDILFIIAGKMQLLEKIQKNGS